MNRALVRPCTDADIAAITAIYGHYVAHSTATFEETPPDAAEMASRRQRVLNEGMPYLVAELDGAVVGYAYATIYRTRSAYRFTAEDSIYIHHEHSRKGIGAQLLGALIAECERIGCRQMVAVMSDGAAPGSPAFHARFGFTPAGALHAVGFKFGRWIDTERMQLTLGSGAATPPAERA